MMNFVIISRRSARRAKENLHVATLPVALAVLGVEKKKVNQHSRYSYKGRFASLYDVLEEARNNHRKMIKQSHPDAGGSGDKAATLNVAWARVRELLKRKGVVAFLCAFLFYGCAANNPTTQQTSPPLPPGITKTLQNKSGVSVQPQSIQPSGGYLYWDYPPQELPSVAFNIWESTDIAAPMENWKLLGTTTGLSFPVPVSNTRDFYRVSAFYVSPAN